MFMEVLASFLTAISFGVLFNIKGKPLMIAGIGGGITWLSYKLLLTHTLSESASLFIAAICFSIYCEICARIYKVPTTMLSVCCLIPLVPGYGVYNTMYNFLLGDYIKGLEFATQTLSSAGSLALGVILVTTIFRNIIKKKYV